MPTVPYVPVATEKPSGQGAPGVSINTPEGAFGGGVAHALQGLGQTIEQSGGKLAHYGDEIFQRALALQQLQNETVAKEADAQYMSKAGDLHLKFQSLEGKARVEAFDGYKRDLNTLRVQIRDSLPSDNAKKMYDSSSLSTMGHTIFNGAGAAAAAQKQWSHGASAARQDMLLNTIAQNPTDDISNQQILAKLRNEVRFQGGLQGWDDVQIKDQTLKIESKALAARIDGLAKTAPWKAKELFDANEGKLHFEDRRAMENTVLNATHTAGARNISDQVLTPLYRPEEGAEDKGLEAYMDEARKKAQELAPNDPDMVHFAIARVRQDYGTFKSGRRDTDNRNMMTINSAFSGDYGGVVPHNPDQLVGLGSDVKAAYEALDPKQRLGVNKALEKLAANADKVDPLTSGRERQKITGLAQSDDTVADFLDINPWSDEYRLTIADRKAITSLQKQVKKDPTGDPRVRRAMGWLRVALGTDMQELGVYNRTGVGSNKDDYDRFQGAMHEAIEAWSEANKGRAPGQTETIEIGKQLLYQQKATPQFNVGSGLILGTLFGGKEKPIFNQDIPQERIDEIKAYELETNQRQISDAQARQGIIREQLLRLYKNKAATKVEGKPTGVGHE